MANHFMRKAAERYGCTPLPFSKTLMDAFHKYDWPGNLREMENIVNRYLILGNEKEVLREILPSETAQCSLEATAMRPQNEMELKQHVRDLKREAESAVIARKLGENGWNRKAAANDLKISYKALLYKIKQYNLEENRTA
jgi:DNA-binding NtrC family response regulator